MTNAHTTFRGLGLEIDFPFEPYGIQKNMMNKMTTTLMNKEHSLIESPTGTGKTLVLLCSSLAWQKRSKLIGKPFISERLKKSIAAKRREKLMNQPCTCGKRSAPDDCKEFKKKEKEKENDVEVIEVKAKTKKADDDMIDLDCYIIEPDAKKQKMEPEDEPKKGVELKKETCEKMSGDSDEFCLSCMAIEAQDRFEEIFGQDSADTDAFVTANIKTKIPRIYYGTRTHKQITQVVRELNKTPYKKGLRMCILSSRERTCINNEVKDNANRNDLCQELLKNSKNSNGISFKKKKKDSEEGCPFYKDSSTLNQIFEAINTDFEDRAWDIEDAAKFGNRNAACPYFGVRALQDQADITFSPYNYLLDPTIRNTLNINLSNAIVIFDEAHNIEDICRESASFVIDTKQIDDILETINIAASHYMQGTVIMDAYQFFKGKFLNLKSYLVKYVFPGEAQKGGDFLHKKILTRNELLNDLTTLGLGSDNLIKIKENLKALKGDDEESSKESSTQSNTQQPALSFAQMSYITQLCITLDFMYANNNKYIDDFRGVVSQALERDFGRSNRGFRGHQDDTSARHIWQFSLLCMNPGIAFDKIHSLAWSVVVASGTLSPIESLKTELGCQFSQVFEGTHVVAENRIFASVVSRGPNNIDLNCGWSNSLELKFQDDVGAVVRDVCLTVPHGVLCFFPSYDRMENLYQRWFTKGFINAIQGAGKKLFREEKKMQPATFEQELDKFNKNARNTGAVLFAVFRGKVSEGIDFADEAARAVITIGIPYPNFKETTVGLKRDYNDVARRTKPHLMTGGDWYSSQAFRALNQALGRCIRHKEDWGAIIMIDSRLNTQQNLSSISKWLRRNLHITNDYSIMKRSLKDFVKQKTNVNSADFVDFSDDE